MSIIQRLAEIRQLQGREAMPDPTKIDGPPMAPPPLPEDFGETTVSEQDEFEDEQARGGVYIPPPISPLVAAAQPKGLGPSPEISPKFLSGAPQGPVMNLCVFDSEAGYLGHAVTLNDREVKAVIQIVLKALQRVVKEHLASLVKLTPKRARKARAVAPAALMEPGPVPGTLQPTVAPKKRRGRPRGSLLK